VFETGHQGEGAFENFLQSSMQPHHEQGMTAEIKEIVS